MGKAEQEVEDIKAECKRKGWGFRRHPNGGIEIDMSTAPQERTAAERARDEQQEAGGAYGY